MVMLDSSKYDRVQSVIHIKSYVTNDIMLTFFRVFNQVLIT